MLPILLRALSVAMLNRLSNGLLLNSVYKPYATHRCFGVFLLAWGRCRKALGPAAYHTNVWSLQHRNVLRHDLGQTRVSHLPSGCRGAGARPLAWLLRPACRLRRLAP